MSYEATTMEPTLRQAYLMRILHKLNALMARNEELWQTEYRPIVEVDRTIETDHPDGFGEFRREAVALRQMTGDIIRDGRRQRFTQLVRNTDELTLEQLEALDTRLMGTLRELDVMMQERPLSDMMVEYAERTPGWVLTRRTDGTIELHHFHGGTSNDLTLLDGFSGRAVVYRYPGSGSRVGFIGTSVGLDRNVVLNHLAEAGWAWDSAGDIWRNDSGAIPWRITEEHHTTVNAAFNEVLGEPEELPRARDSRWRFGPWAAELHDEAREAARELASHGMDWIRGFLGTEEETGTQEVIVQAEEEPQGYGERDNIASIDLRYDEDEERMDVTVTYKDDRENHTFTFTAVTNDVRTIENGRRQLSDPAEYPRGSGQYFYPRQFPEGTWRLLKSGTSTNPEIGRIKIPTNAWSWTRWYRKEIRETRGGGEVTEYVFDRASHGDGFLIHSGTGTTTWGCIKMSDSNVAELARWVDAAIDSSGETAGSITVEGTGISRMDHAPDKVTVLED